jgi:hypothetical protein
MEYGHGIADGAGTVYRLDETVGQGRISEK